MDIKERMDIKELYRKIQESWDKPIRDLVDGNLNNTDSYGDTLLHYAAKSNDAYTVKKLLKEGIIYDHQNNEGKKPLDVADSSEIIDLLKSCENFFKKIKDGNINEISKHLSKFKMLINVNRKDFYSPLLEAISFGNEAVVRLLLKNGADVFQVTHKGFTSLHIAVSQKDNEIAQLLLQNVKKDKLFRYVNSQIPENENTCLHIAAENGDFEILELLLRNGAIYNIKNKLDKMPIHLCKAEFRREEIFLKIIDNLFEYAKNGKPRLINELNQLEISKFEAATNAKNVNQHTLLQVLTRNNHKVIAEKLTSLLERKNKKVKSRQWTLKELNDLASLTHNIYRIIQTNISIILREDYLARGEYLLNTQTPLETVLFCLIRLWDFLSTCKEYSSALDIDDNIAKIETVLEELQFDPNEVPIFYENQKINDNIMTQREKVFYKLLYNTSDEESKQKVLVFIGFVENQILPSLQGILPKIGRQKIHFQSSSELMKCIEENNVSEVFKVLKRGADVNFINVAGESPLQRAIKYGFTDIVDILLEKKADINFVTPEGDTYLHLAATLNVSFFFDRDIPFSIAVRLLKHGAVYDAKNHEGKTPLNVSLHRKVSKLLKSIDLCFKHVRENSMDVVLILGDMSENEPSAVMQTRNDEGYTLLQTASLNPDKKLAREILAMLKKSKIATIP